MNIYLERIEVLRSLMRTRSWDAVIITGSDPHSSEYPAPRWKQVEWLTGFTGESGDVVITLDHAGLWTDTRYFIQAVQQLEGTGVELHKTRVPEQVLIPQWIEQNFDEEATIAVDGLCVSADYVKGLNTFVVSVPDLLNILWKDRPEIPSTAIFTVNTGYSREEKIEFIKDFLQEQNCNGILISSLDQIAWLLDIRANDIDYNPYAISYLLISYDKINWYVNSDYYIDGVNTLPYEDINFLPIEFEGRLFVDPSTLNYEIYSKIEDLELVEGQNPIELKKSIKTPFEIESMKECHIRDGVAMVKFLCTLEEKLNNNELIDEYEAAQLLAQYRSEAVGYQGDSFETISAYGSAAALPHYCTPKINTPILEKHSLYLCDSGGHYLDGTTDITRTIPLGPCSELEIEDYTLVLKGYIQLSKAIFPYGTAGCQLDCLARNPLWQAKRNFGHGTGHGVGYFLGVHEGPQDIRQNFNTTPLLPGMVVSIEPGIYREGSHGVRHENLVYVTEAGSNDFGSWLCFEPLTLCPFDTSVIDFSIMTKDEIEWLNDYHSKIYKILSPYLDDKTQQWLKNKTLCINLC